MVKTNSIKNIIIILDRGFYNMDQIKIGKFIATLRNEKNLTQEMLGDKLGVTNKTISRWENGHYIPDIEMLQLLNKEFGVSINELITGERIEENNYKEKAEENLLTALDNSTFTLKEKTDYFKKKWLKEHIAEMVLMLFIWIGVIIFFKLNNEDYVELGFIGGFMIVTFYAALHNQMRRYIEDKIYNGKK